MGTPTWLYYLFGGLMLAVAGYASVLLVLSLTSRRTAGRDVDISHLFMGVAMAGMFVPAWTFGPDAVWELVFAALMVWFIVGTVRSIRRFGPHVPHALVHAAMSFAMILMYWYPRGVTSGGGSMSMSGRSGGVHLDAGLGLLLALVFLGSAIFTLASPVKGASHHGSHVLASRVPETRVPDTRVPVLASGGGPPSGVHPGPHGGDSVPTGNIEARVAIPWLEDMSHVVMCIGMAFMLILMI